MGVPYVNIACSDFITASILISTSSLLSQDYSMKVNQMGSEAHLYRSELMCVDKR